MGLFVRDKVSKINELERSGAKLPRRVVPRQIEQDILPWLKREEIIVITGARQIGKSVLLYRLIYNQLLPKTSNVFYFNLDVPGQIDFFDDPGRLVELINRSKSRTYIFIDEIQRLKEPGMFLKGLYDLHLSVKFIVSGSSTLEIKSKVQEALTGRKIVFHLQPFNLLELSQALFPGEEPEQTLTSENKYNLVLDHYFRYGGYPAVALAGDRKIKLRLIEEIFRSYLEKDIKTFLKVENETAFINLVKVLASQVGSLINKHELSSTLGIHKNTLDKYLFYLEQTFVLDFVRPFFKNPRKELVKSPKVYFRDLGLRNFAIANFSDFRYRPDRGAIFENLVYLLLSEERSFSSRVNFWRTKSGAEVDFILMKGMNPVPFEAKASELKEFKIGRSLRSFIEKYRPEVAYCVNLSLKGDREFEKTKVYFISPAQFLTTKMDI